MSKPIFITGIGTGIGKTLVSAIVAEALQAHYWKPVQAGYADGTDSHWIASNTGDSIVVHPEIYRLAMPASPHIAAREEEVQIDISRIVANKLQVKVGDEIVIHFFQNPPRARKVSVAGIYETNLSEYFDSSVILGDLRMIQRLNDWSDSLAGGLEVFVKDAAAIEDVGYDIGEKMDFDLAIESVNDKYIQVFEWLNLISRQVNILLGVILVVVSVNIVSVVLILVMERTQMIGMLKALGGGDKFISSVFIYNGVNLIAKGLLLGNVIGLGLCFVQYQFKIIKLNPHDYYMSFVPISWHWEIVVLLNLITLGLVTLILLLPTMAIARITPIKAIRFD